VGNGLTYANIPYSSSKPSYRGQEKEQQQPVAASPTATEEERRIYAVTDGLRSRQTARVYKSTFSEFIRYLQNIDLKILLEYRHDVIVSKIILYLEYLRNVRKLNYWTIQGHYFAILHFFDINDVYLNSRKIKKFLPSEDNENYRGMDRPYSMEEVSKILERCDVRERFIVLLMVSTGMRVGAIPGLRVGDIKKIDEFNLYLVNVYANSRKDRYYVFTTPECAQAIDDYLSYRKRFYEEIRDSSPLIRDKISIDNPFTSRVAKPIGVRALQIIIKAVEKEAGVLLKNSREVMRTHGFRKLYVNQLDKSGVQFSCREFLTGHRLPFQDAAYVRVTEEDRLTEYLKAVPQLTIDPKSRLRDKICELETEQAQEIATLKSKYATLEQKYQKFNILGKKFIDFIGVIETLKKKVPDLEFEIGEITPAIEYDDEDDVEMVKEIERKWGIEKKKQKQQQVH
jgi:integrase